MTDFISRRDLIRSERAKDLFEDQSRAKLIYMKLLDPQGGENKFLESDINDARKTIRKLTPDEEYKTDEQIVLDDLKKLPSLKKLLKRAKKKRNVIEKVAEYSQNTKLKNIYTHLRGKRYKDNNVTNFKAKQKIRPLLELDWPQDLERRKKRAMRNNGKYLYSRFNYMKQRNILENSHRDELSITRGTGFTSFMDRDYSRIGRLTHSSFVHPREKSLSMSPKHNSVDDYYEKAEEMKYEKKNKQKKRFEAFIQRNKKNGKFVGAKMRAKQVSGRLEKVRNRLKVKIPKKEKMNPKKKDLMIVTPYLSTNPAIKWNSNDGKIRSFSHR